MVASETEQEVDVKGGMTAYSIESLLICECTVTNANCLLEAQIKPRTLARKFKLFNTNETPMKIPVLR